MTEAYLRDCFGEFQIENYKFMDYGFFSNFKSQDGKLWGTGFRQKKEESVNVSVSEAVERYTFFEAYNNKMALTPQFPTSCGFAAGTNREKAYLRSVLEGLERWAISQWIDFNYHIEIYSDENDHIFSPFIEKFDRVTRYLLHFNKNDHEVPFDTILGICICEKDDGVYMGSRACHSGDNPWEHSMLEAWINMNNVINLTLVQNNFDFIEQRIFFFSKNKKIGLNSIPLKNIKRWPKAEVLYSNQISKETSPFFVFRTIFKDYKPWHLGTKDRFVY
jgi:hypothetical protein